MCWNLLNAFFRVLNGGQLGLNAYRYTNHAKYIVQSLIRMHLIVDALYTFMNYRIQC